MKSTILIYVLTIMTIASCNSEKSIEKRKNELAKVCFAIGGCYGTCPFLAIEIDSSLNYNFFGGKYSDKTGWFTGKVSQGFWDTLNIKFESINFKQLDTSYQNSVDGESYEMILYFGDKQKHIYAEDSDLPDSVQKVFRWLSNTYKTISLSKVADESIKFETRIEKGPPAVMKTIRFTPPTEEELERMEEEENSN